MPGTVSVACKLPNGIHLDVFRMDEWDEQTIMGVRKTRKAVKTGRITLRGTGRRSDDPRISYGYALTHNVDADHWAAWLDANRESDLVKNGLIFASVKTPDVHAQAREHEKLKSGLEPIDPKDLPPEFKRKIETATKDA